MTTFSSSSRSDLIKAGTASTASEPRSPSPSAAFARVSGSLSVSFLINFETTAFAGLVGGAGGSQAPALLATTARNTNVLTARANLILASPIFDYHCKFLWNKPTGQSQPIGSPPHVSWHPIVRQLTKSHPQRGAIVPLPRPHRPSYFLTIPQSETLY